MNKLDIIAGVEALDAELTEALKTIEDLEERVYPSAAVKPTVVKPTHDFKPPNMKPRVKLSPSGEEYFTVMGDKTDKLSSCDDVVKPLRPVADVVADLVQAMREKRAHKENREDFLGSIEANHENRELRRWLKVSHSGVLLICDDMLEGDYWSGDLSDACKQVNGDVYNYWLQYVHPVV